MSRWRRWDLVVRLLGLIRDHIKLTWRATTVWRLTSTEEIKTHPATMYEYDRIDKELDRVVKEWEEL